MDRPAIWVQDDILLISKDSPTHQVILAQLATLVEKYGIMLSAKKSHIGQAQIEFLGLTFEDGFFQPGEHIYKELLNFPDGNLS
ncbi:hypothetical protein PIB30_048496, partial [Stylosanthes scabra]|nr:hypothetical protein [Stylosanthes scabra]